jgi:short-subunit dehydrogenase
MAKKTALITGASSGLGVEFANQLAARGVNLIISARRVERLHELAERLRTEYKIDVQVVPADLTSPMGVSRLQDVSASNDVDILINNAGFGQIGQFATSDTAGVEGQLRVNVLALTTLSRHFVGPMLARQSGAIINIASTAAYQPTPNMAVYGATKAYVLAFTEALWCEVQGSGVQVLAVSPGGTATEFFDVAGGRLATGRLDTPQHVVNVALKALDSGNRKGSVIVGGVNAVMAFATRFVSRKAVVKMASKVMKANH